ncbi:hypothetical protein QJS10_CPA05g00499 [Acorus calamus]|uniref:Uncharacterized protein n=1 Tax=Acorus calamus TaxID=4465 RepID=A0AAV9EPN3_ACOCL|nr:hypothetical protein QJS10_CPA05g00499 [Acorus calamus]
MIGRDAEQNLLTEDERKALRGSRFAPLPSSSSSSTHQPSCSQPRRLAHPNGPMTTNKAAALAKFLERKLKEPGGLNSMDPDLLERAIKNAKETVNASKSSSSGKHIRHVTSFGDSSEDSEEDDKHRDIGQETKPKRKKKKKHKSKKSKFNKNVGHTDEAVKTKKRKRISHS